MQQLNNLDVVILILTALSALIAVYRGFVREVMSIVGWVLAAVAVFYLLPILTPFAKIYIASSMMAGFVTSLIILIVFYVIWLLSVDSLISKIRTSKLNSLDRMLGLLFGVLRACLLVVLFNILVNWTLPEEAKSGIFKDSRCFTLAGKFAEPVEALIPQNTIDMIKNQSSKVGLGEEKKKPEKDKKQTKENKEKDKQTKEKQAQEEMDDLFEKLVQPQIEQKIEEHAENFDGYNKNETDNLDRLIETSAQ